MTYFSYSENVTAAVLRRCDLRKTLPPPHDPPLPPQNAFDAPAHPPAHFVSHLHPPEDDQRTPRRNLLPRLDHNLQHLPRHWRIGRSLLRRGLGRGIPGGP